MWASLWMELNYKITEENKAGSDLKCLFLAVNVFVSVVMT